MPKRICILIFGLFIAQPFTASAISVESDSDSDTDLQLTKLASRNVLDSDESSKTVEDIRRISQYANKFKKNIFVCRCLTSISKSSINCPQ